MVGGPFELLKVSVLGLCLVSAAEVHWAELKHASESEELNCSAVSNVSIPQFGVVWNVKWNISELHIPSGVLLADTYTYRTTVCGAIENASCASKPWNLEMVTRVNQSATYHCLQGITEWKDDTVSDGEVWRVRYFLKAKRNTIDSDPYPLGVTVEIIDEVDDSSCTFGMAKAFFNVICSTDATEYRSINEDLDNCIWNISIRSPNGCVEYTESTPSPTESTQLTTEGEDDSGNGKDEDTVFLGLGWLYLFVFGFVTLAVVCLLFGVLYNWGTGQFSFGQCPEL